MPKQATITYVEDAAIYAKVWEEKLCLRQVYTEFYKNIKSHLSNNLRPKIIEIGSGIGAIKSVIPDCICTDIIKAPGIDRCENIYDLSDECSDASDFILFDVFHHIEFPGNAFAELHENLASNGRVLIFEPYISLCSFFVYQLFHHEPVGLFAPIAWNNHTNTVSNIDQYYTAQANATKVFTKKKYRKMLEQNWRIDSIQTDSAFRYLASGGFRGPQLYSTSGYKALVILDAILSKFPFFFGSRILIVLEKK